MIKTLMRTTLKHREEILTPCHQLKTWHKTMMFRTGHLASQSRLSPRLRRLPFSRPLKIKRRTCPTRQLSMTRLLKTEMLVMNTLKMSS